MTIYAIGDVQGCFKTLQTLLTVIQFDPKKDHLWFTGDLVNRGSGSLEVLRFVKNLGITAHTVLGNHDLHLLAVAYSAYPLEKEDTLQTILQAPDKKELLEWLRQQPLLYHDADLQMTLVHAGIAPSWTISQAAELAREVEYCLQSDKCVKLLSHLYGDMPDRWSEDLTGWDRLRCISNHLTRMRFCDAQGRLVLSYKGTLKEAHANLIPWFQMPNWKKNSSDILFGHWAALNGETHTPHVHALDTGCVWGYHLTAMRLADQKRFSVPCQLEDLPS